MCSIATVLDPESAAALVQMYPGSDSATPARAQPLNNSQLSHTPSNPANRSAHRGLPDYSRSSRRAEREACKHHPDEEINYFCFECMCPPICSECVIHGDHKGHNVQTIKKSYPLITDKLEDLVIHIGSKIDDLHVVEQRIETRKRDLVDQANTIKQKMANAFEDIRQRLEKKEREIMANADNFSESKIKEMDGIIRILNGRSQVLNQSIEQVKSNLRERDDGSLLEYFALEFPKIAQSTDSDLPQLREISEQA